MRKFLLVIFFLSQFLSETSAQPFFQRTDSIKVLISGLELKYPWAGGMNFCEFSTIDLNQDGIKDLFVFDKTGNKITTYLNNGTANNVDYTLAPDYAKKFPPIHDWVMLIDYNCDGKEDIFSYSDLGGGTMIYKNTSTIGSGLSFQLVKPLLYSKYNSTTTTNLYISSVSVPAINDIDNDGDLDILTFSILGSQVEYHQNQSKELYGTCDSLAFELKDNCWGKFSESSCSVSLGQSCKGAAVNGTEDSQHSGSCLMCADFDNDIDKEVLIGDIACKKLAMLTNGGTPAIANMSAEDGTFPSYDTPVDISMFPCAFFVDVNNDGNRDLLVGSNAPNISENFKSSWYYKNTNTDSSPIFQFQQNNFLQDQMIEVGEGSYPVMFDADADGLLDLIVGNYGYYSGTGQVSKLSLYKNIGTVTSPKFDLITRDYQNLSATAISGMAPTFADIDNDGDEDMIIGAYDGRLHLFTNSAGVGNPAVFTLTQANLGGIDVGAFATPQIIDMDNDGVKDLIIGEQSGNINYYRNTGTISSPTFTLVKTNLGAVDVRRDGNFTGYSAPYLFGTFGSRKMIVGSESGYLYMYENIDGNLGGNFNRTDSAYLSIWEGSRVAPFVTNINNDAYLDLFLGNYSGGVTYFNGVSVIGINEIKNADEVKIYPNPAKENFTINVDEKAEVLIYSVEGNLVNKLNLNKGVNTINVNTYKNGVYIIKTIINRNVLTNKIIVLNSVE